MKSTLDKKNTEAVFKCSLDKEEWESEINAAYNRTKKRFKVPGFRPGHAPRKFIEMHYGASVFYDEAVDACINRAYTEQLAAHPELDTFGSPSVSLEKPEGDDVFAFTMTVTLYPEAKLGDYKGIKLPKIEYNVTDADVEKHIQDDLRRASRLVKVERAAENGDTVNIDYVGTVDGVEFDGGKGEGYDLKLGSNSFIPGFEDQLVGIKADEERDVNVTFPEEYHAAELKGKAAVFRVKAHEVRAEEMPELNDEFVKERYTDYDGVEAYKAGVRDNLAKAAAERTRSERIDAVMKAVSDKAVCEIPEKIVDAEVDRMYHEFEHQLSHYGISPEDYLKYSNSSVEQFRSERREPAAANVKMRLVMRAIIDAEKIDVTEEEVKAKLAADERLRAACEHEAHHHGGEAAEYAHNDVLTDKFFDFMLANNSFTEAVKTDGATEEKKPAAKKTAAKKPATEAKDGAAEKKPAAKKPAAKKPAAVTKE